MKQNFFRRFLMKKREWAVRVVYVTHRPDGILKSKASGIVSARTREEAVSRFLQDGYIARHAVCRSEARPL